MIKDLEFALPNNIAVQSDKESREYLCTEKKGIRVHFHTAKNEVFYYKCKVHTILILHIENQTI